MVIDRSGEEYDVLLEEARIDVVRALAKVRFFYDGRDENGHGFLITDIGTIYKNRNERNTSSQRERKEYTLIIVRLHRFYVRYAIFAEKDNTLSDPELAHQLRRVFRLQAGDKAVFFDGSDVEHVSEIVSLSKDMVLFRVIETRPVQHVPQRNVALALSLIKKDNFELVAQKCTEIGVSEFIPLVSERSEKKALNMKRLKKIVIEACEQSGRGAIPLVREPVALEDFLNAEPRNVVAFHTDGEKAKTDVFEIDNVVLCIGPEGGWSDTETELFRSRKAALAKLDLPILRAETAAIVVATLFLYRS
ncbi:MAG TPA: RsmE family RNA methyltransferase [Candidatus Paceibacterota bacterium]|nr:RsmE family RNA methyltransferase [Candidatus Paceibacterota bacterium]